MNIATIIKSPIALTKAQGEKIRDRIIKKLSEDKRVTVDCGEITCMSFPFIEPISEIVFLYSAKKLKENLRFINLSQFHTDMIKQSFEKQKKIKKLNKKSE